MPGLPTYKAGERGSLQYHDLLSTDCIHPLLTSPGDGGTDEAGFCHHSPVSWDSHGSSGQREPGNHGGPAMAAESPGSQCASPTPYTRDLGICIRGACGKSTKDSDGGRQPGTQWTLNK